MQGVDGCMSPPVLLQQSWDMLKVLPIFVFSFTCHQNIFLVHNEIGDNSIRCGCLCELLCIASTLVET